MEHVIASVRMWFGLHHDEAAVDVLDAISGISIAPKYSVGEVYLMRQHRSELVDWLGYKNPVCEFARTGNRWENTESVTVWKCEDPEGRTVAAKMAARDLLRDEVQVLNHVFQVPGIDPETLMGDRISRGFPDKGVATRLMHVNPAVPLGIVRWIQYHCLEYQVSRRSDTGRRNIGTFVMEHLQLVDPSSHVINSATQFFHVAQVLLEALVWLHDTHGIVHADIAPANIMWRPSDGIPVLVDFGMATGPKGVRLRTLQSVIRGQPERVAPEMVEGRYELNRWDSEALPTSHHGSDKPSLDIWALGGVFAEWLSGIVRPFTRGSRVDWNDLGARVMVLAGQRSWVLEHKGAEFVRSHLTAREGWSNEDIEEAIGLMESMLALEHEARPSARECLALLTSGQ